MTEINGSFYPTWPTLDGKPLNLQWGEVRLNTANTKALVRQSVQELETGYDELSGQRALLGQEYGDIAFHNKYRLYYDAASSDEEFLLQKNDGTVESPVWTDVFKVRFHDGNFSVVAPGGITSAAGFYGPGLQSISEIAESGSEGDISVLNPTKILFNANSGLEVSLITTGAYKGHPQVTNTQPYGRAEVFSATGSEWAINHQFNTAPVIAQIMDSDGRIMIPDKADVSDPNTAYFYFSQIRTGTAYIASGGLGAVSLVLDNLQRGLDVEKEVTAEAFYVRGGGDLSATGVGTTRVSKNAASNVEALSGDSKNITPDFSKSNTYYVKLQKNTTIKNPTNLPGSIEGVGLSTTIQIVTEQPSEGFYSITWDSDYMFPLTQLGDRGGPNATQTPASIDAFTFVSLPNLSQGEKLLGTAAFNFY